MNEEKRIIEINGIKMEIDLRYAKEISHYRIGDRVKVLIKRYSDTFESCPGIIVGFDNFQQRPTIVAAYLSSRYNESPLQFLYFNKDSKDVEICPMVDDVIAVEKASVLEIIDRDINRRDEEIKILLEKRHYFLKHFGQYFSDYQEQNANKDSGN